MIPTHSVRMCIIWKFEFIQISLLGMSAEEFLSQSSVRTGLVSHMLTWGFLCAVPDHIGNIVSKGCPRGSGVEGGGRQMHWRLIFLVLLFQKS